MTGAIEIGLLYAFLALGVYLTFRILEFPDLTVDASFTTGAAIAAVGIIGGLHPLLATVAAFGGGLLAGLITGFLHTVCKINGLLAGIITMIGLYSINLRIMGSSNLPLLRETTLISPLREGGLLGTWSSIAIFAVVIAVFAGLLVWFLATNFGLAMRATGDNPAMIRAAGVNTDFHKTAGLALSNGLVATGGALVAQFQGFADIGMGIGMIVAGLASVIVGQAIFGRLPVWRAVTAVVIGAVLYRLVFYFALSAGLNPNDMKLVSAVLVVLALVIPQWQSSFNAKRRTRRALAAIEAGQSSPPESVITGEQSTALDLGASPDPDQSMLDAAEGDHRA